MYTEERLAGRRRKLNVETLLAPLIPVRGITLDLGCGLGIYTAWIADWEPLSEVVGVDISQESIDRAIQRPTITYYRSSWDDFVYTGPLDLVLATEVLEHAEDPEQLCKKWPRTTWVITVPVERPAPEENRWTPDGHGYLQTFNQERVLNLFPTIQHFSTDGNYFYLVGK